MIFNLFRSYRRLEDEELITQYKKKGDLRYAGELYQRYSQLIAGICLKYLKHKEDAQDAAMDVFEIICLDLRTHDVQKPSNWLYTVTKNHCLKLIRKRKKETPQEDIDKKFPDHFMDFSAKDSLLNEDRLETELMELKTALNKLKTEQRTCVELFYLEKKTYQEISDITGYPLKSVKSHIQNGKRKLKIEIENRLEKEQ